MKLLIVFCLLYSVYALNQDSTVLITGAAGFLGSELALALYKVYNVTSLVLIDSLEPHHGVEDLKLYEYKRQRLFRVLQTTQAPFYKIDVRQYLPEFHPQQVSALEHIFQTHSITHCVHLAEQHNQTQIFPRTVNVPKTKLIQPMLQFCPKLVYASSYEVYTPSSKPLSEEDTITTPYSIAGASKIIDEILASESNNTVGVGLRFFNVYGPWDVPTSFVHQLIERAVRGEAAIEVITKDIVQDYIYIDDAVNAIMAAMQVQSQHHEPLIFNVGTGDGFSQRDVTKALQKLLPFEITNVERDSEKVDSFIASTDRQKYLGVQPQVSLQEGLQKTLAWHYERAYPYRHSDKHNYTEGALGCNKYDQDCLLGTPVFPCASECAHKDLCIPTLFDDVVQYTRKLTADCTNVMYTVALDDDITILPSAFTQVSVNSKSHFPGSCNIAFLSSSSHLITKLRSERGAFSMLGKEVELQHGFWKIVPMAVSKQTREKLGSLSLLPKLSPGHFFAEKTQVAIYVDPRIIFDNVHSVVDDFNDHPVRQRDETVLIAGRRQNPWNPRRHGPESQYDISQERAYRSIRIGLSDSIKQNIANLVDTSFLVHRLHIDDARVFRCDAFGETIQWGGANDAAAIEFILSLHDMWSGVSMEEMEIDPWWTHPQRNEGNHGRRLAEAVEGDEDEDEPGNEEGDEESLVHKDFGIKEEGVAKQGDELDSDEDDEGSGDEEAADTSDQRSFSLRSDSWMAILSSGSTQYFAHIVPFDSLGAVDVEQYFREAGSEHTTATS